MTMSKPILLVSIGFLVFFVRAWGQEGPIGPVGRILKKRQTNENQEFLNAHNDRRRNVNPSASNMKEMIWSDELYTIARNYVEQCSFNHNSQRSSQSQTFSYVGENIYMGSFGPLLGVNPIANVCVTGTATDAVRSWDEEKSDYDLSSNTCTGICGHYTQVVWTNSEYLGCARKRCGNSYLVVCNYGPGGNFNNLRPYTAGATCSQCPAGYTCNNQLCSKSSTSNPCDPNPCQNGGVCSQTSGNALCNCASGWTGIFCETQVNSNPCDPNPCANGGTCSSNTGSAMCTCTSSWTGSLCQTPVNSNPCDPNPCANGGTCSSNSGSAMCTCTSGWTGTLCQTPVNSNPCEPNPCANGGTCSSNSGAAVCTCTSRWTGSLCQNPATTNVLFQCGFETGMCLQNDPFSTFSFHRTQSFSGINSAPEGNYYALATSSSQSQLIAWLLPEQYLPVALVRVEFEYTSTGSGELFFSYGQGENTQYYSLFSTSGDNGIWKSASVTVPAGQLTFYYFTGRVGVSNGPGSVAVDNIRVIEL